MHDNSIFVGPAELQVAMSTASQIVKRPFLSCSKPLLQSEATGKCTTIEMRISFYSHAHKTHFHKKGFV